MVFLITKDRHKKDIPRGSRQNGQAMVEYILILTITVSLVALFSKKFFKPFGQYADAVMGSYVGCLLDKGVLPNLGSGSDDGCSEVFKALGDNPFTPQNGKSTAEAAKANSEKNSNKPSEMSEMANSRNGGSGRGRSVGSSSLGPRVNSSGSTDTTGNKGDEKITSIPNPLGKTKYYKVFRIGAAFGSSRQREIGIAGLFTAERERLKRQQEKTQFVASVEDGESFGKKKKLAIKPKERKIAEAAEQKPMGFGGYFRMFIVIAIILAIVIFMGMQINQMSASWEKN